MIDESQAGTTLEVLKLNGENPRELSYRAIDTVNGYLERITHQPTCKPALNLHMYNFFVANPKSDELQAKQEISRYQRVIKRELQAAKDQDPPSVGCEVEVPYTFFPFEEPNQSSLTTDLFRMGITVKKEVTGNNPTEFELPPTTSASVQSQMILELRKMGLIPLDKTFSSLQITLGIPTEISQTEGIAFLMSDLLTYAFVNPGRVESRGNSDFYESVKINRTNYQPIKEGYSQGKRVEFRTPRIMGSKTYRLIQELQQIGKLLFSSDPNLIPVRQQFEKEVLILLVKNNLDINLPEDDPGFAADSIRQAVEIKRTSPGTSNLRDDAREIMSRYAQRIKVASNPIAVPMAA